MSQVCVSCETHIQAIAQHQVGAETFSLLKDTLLMRGSNSRKDRNTHSVIEYQHKLRFTFVLDDFSSSILIGVRLEGFDAEQVH